MPAATSAPNAMIEDDQDDRERQQPGLAEILGGGFIDGADRAHLAELADGELRVVLLQPVDPVEDRLDLVGRLVRLAADLELDESRAPVGCDLAGVGRVERRANVLDGVQLRDARDDVDDRGLERGIVGVERGALDEDALPGRLLEAGVEDPVDAPGLAGARRVRVDGLRADRAPDREGDDDQREPAERRGLPVGGAPAAHPGREVGVGCGGYVTRSSSLA